MATRISPLAVVDSRAQLGQDVVVGPFCMVGPDVEIGDGSILDSHVAIKGPTTIGRENHFFANCVIGGDPQDLTYSGAPTRLEIGDGNLFREGVTVNRGAEKEDHSTRIGHHNMLMANCHVAHNCHLHDHVVLVNGSLLGGHVHVHDGAIVSGNSVVHHFATLGTLSFVSGGSRVPRDLPPYMLCEGADMRIVTVNVVGMRRKGIPAQVIDTVKRIHRWMFREFKSLQYIKQTLTAELGETLPAEVAGVLDFVELSQSGKLGRAGEARRNQKFNPEENAAERRRAA